MVEKVKVMLKYTPRGMIEKMNLKLGLNLGIRIHVMRRKIRYIRGKVKYIERMKIEKLSMLRE